jgi:hypothetical protein
MTTIQRLANQIDRVDEALKHSSVRLRKTALRSERASICRGTRANDPEFSVVMLQKTLRIVSWLAIIGLVVLTIVPADERPATVLRHGFEHFFAFGLTGLLFGRAQPRQLRANLLGAVVFSVALELSQIPLPTRHARLEDFVVDAFAACLGISVAYASRYLIRGFVAAR